MLCDLTTYVALVIKASLRTGTDPGIGTVIGIVLGASGLVKPLSLAPSLGAQWRIKKFDCTGICFSRVPGYRWRWLVPFFTSDIITFTPSLDVY